MHSDDEPTADGSVNHDCVIEPDYYAIIQGELAELENKISLTSDTVLVLLGFCTLLALVSLVTLALAVYLWGV